MGITKVKVSNFKSFNELEVELRPLNIVVGANAAGKSNLLEIFKFLRDLKESGLENAVSLQGGIEYLANRKVGSSRPISVKVSSSLEESPVVLEGEDKFRLFTPLEATYSISLGRASQGFEILREEVDHRCDLWDVEDEQHERFYLSVLRTGGSVQSAVRPAELGSSLGMHDKVLRSPLGIPLRLKLSPKESLLSVSETLVVPDIAFFDFDPTLPKRATPITGRARLDPDGGNLAIALKATLSDPARAARFSRLLRDLLPFVADLRVENLADKSLLFLLRETFSGEEYLPAAFLSNGTIQIAALLLALYFERSDVVIIEEPERNIHPHLISRVVEMMRDVSTEVHQIVTTTHNPELIKHADLADLLLVQRDQNGFSHVSRPVENAELKIFLENELGIDELYVQNLLSVGHGV